MPLLGVLVATLVATKLLGELAQRIGQPAVLGELLAGVLLGASLLGVLQPNDPVIHALSEIGVLVLLFEIGLHTDLRALLGVGTTAAVVGLVGVVVPFVLGAGAAHLMGLAAVPAIVCGAALTATSIGISARVLSDLGQLETREGQVVLGAAVLDDVVGLIILSVVSALASGASVSAMGVGLSTAAAVAFIVAALVIGSRIAPPLFRAAGRLETEGSLGVLALAFAFFMAWLATKANSASIIGAFAAGLVLHRIPQREAIESKVTTLGHFFVPIFFAAVGAAVDVRTLASGHVALTGGALIVVALVGKFVAGYAPWWFRGSKALVGVAMIPRGEVGLIFAQMGLATGALDVSLFSAIAIMVMVTTFIPPPILTHLTRRRPAAPPRSSAEEGIDDLVVGDG
ncbi:MAG TPA: cation:proton antiporter [Gemmatimonadaceae bacterium]|nr:cation:proton antiporter [Gemmatimonadaceae bacterium]